jgi:galactose-1-phosphate uridylyltransferase
MGLIRALRTTFSAFNTLFEDEAPYMMWWNQAPRTSGDWPDPWLNMELVSPWRANRLPRYIAGVEVATGEYFNPVDPTDVAARLRQAIEE